MSCLIGQLRWHGEMGTLKPRSRCPDRIFIGALSVTFLPIVARTSASVTMPTGPTARCRENSPPVFSVTTTVDPLAARIAATPRSTVSRTSRCGAGRITAPTATRVRSWPKAGMTTSSPMVPRMTSSLVTTSGTGGWARSAGRMSRRLSSGSHSAPSVIAMRSSSGTGDLRVGEQVVGKLAGREHAHGGLVLVHHQGHLAPLLGHQGGNLAHLLVLVGEQWRGAQHVTGLDRCARRRGAHVAAGDAHGAGDQPVEDVVLVHVPHRAAVEEDRHLGELVVGHQLGDRVDRRAGKAEHHLVAHHAGDGGVAGVGGETIGVKRRGDGGGAQGTPRRSLNSAPSIPAT